MLCHERSGKSFVQGKLHLGGFALVALVAGRGAMAVAHLVFPAALLPCSSPVILLLLPFVMIMGVLHVASIH